MESSPEDNLPPLRGFNSEGEPIGVEPDEPPTDTEEEEFRTPAASESVGKYRLRSRAVSLSTCSRSLGVTLLRPIAAWSRSRTGAVYERR